MFGVVIFVSLSNKIYKMSDILYIFCFYHVLYQLLFHSESIFFLEVSFEKNLFEKNLTSVSFVGVVALLNIYITSYLTYLIYAQPGL